MLVLNVCISPLYILFALSLIFVLRRVRIALRLLIAFVTTVICAALITLSASLVTGFDVLFTLLLILAMLFSSLIMLYPILATIPMLGLPPNTQPRTAQKFFYPEPGTSNAVEQSKLLALYKNKILIFLSCFSAAILLISFLLRWRLDKDLDIANFQSFTIYCISGFLAGHVSYRITAAYFLMKRKLYLNWQTAGQFIVWFTISILIGWLGATMVLGENIGTALLCGLVICMGVPAGVFAWQSPLEGHRLNNR
jgi:hypothetical protein